MFSQKHVALPIVVAAALTASCTELVLPRFDGGPLNPHIRHLRAGEIMEGVKCAMVAFMHERELRLMKRREDPTEQRALRDIEPGFSPYQIRIPKKQIGELFPNSSAQCSRGKHYGFTPRLTKSGKVQLIAGCAENRCDAEISDPAERLGASIWDHDLILTGNGAKEKGCIPVPDYSRFALDPNQSASIQLTLSGVTSGFIHYQRIDAIRTPFYPFIAPGNPALGHPFPTLQISPKATSSFDFSAVMPQSVHAYQQTAHASNFVTDEVVVKRDPLVGLPGVQEWRPSPIDELMDGVGSHKREIDELKKTIVTTQSWGEIAEKKKLLTVLVVSSQNSCFRARGIALPMPADERKKRLEQIDKVCVADYFENSLRFAAMVPPEPKTGRQVNKFMQQCRVDIWSFDSDETTRIDFLALKRMLNEVVEGQEKALHRGIPDVTLNSLVLTSTFQIVLEATAGTNHLFRIVPVLAPPNTDVRLDHTHSLKITVNGKKGKGDKNLSKRLFESCRERVAPNFDYPNQQEGQRPDFCASEAGQLLESIVQALEKGGSTP